MIADSHSCTNFRTPLLYVFSQEKQPELIGGQCLGNTAEELMAEFDDVASRSRSQKPCKHFYISFAPEDGKVDVLTKTDIAHDFLKRLGYEDNQYAVVTHGRDDPSHPQSHQHDHMHLIVNAVSFENYQKVDDFLDIKRGIKICRDLEKEYGLTVVSSEKENIPDPPRPHKERIKREQKEFEEGNRNDPPEPYYKSELQGIINKASSDQPTLPDFFDRLIKEGVTPNAYITDQGRKRISYNYKGFNFRGSKLKDGSFPKLIKNRGINYDPLRDEITMEKARQGELNNYSEEPLFPEPSPIEPSPIEKSKDQKTGEILENLLEQAEERKIIVESGDEKNEIELKNNELTFKQDGKIIYQGEKIGDAWKTSINEFTTEDNQKLEENAPIILEAVREGNKISKTQSQKELRKNNQLEL